MFPARYFPTRYFPARYFTLEGGAGPTYDTWGGSWATSWGTTWGGSGPTVDQQYFLKNDSNIYISKVANASADNTNTVNLSVKDFSFNKRSFISDVARNTLDTAQARIINPVLGSVSPVSFSFVTYISPILDTTVTSPEEYLWVSLMGTDNVTSDSSTSVIDFADGNVQELNELTLWFYNPNNDESNYRLDQAVIDRATISFDINSLGEITWEGRALAMVEDNTPPTSTDRSEDVGCIKNKLNTISVNLDSVNYDLALLGGTITIDNDNTFYGRVKLGETTVPTGHYSGNRKISGNLNFYLKTGTNVSGDLFKEILTTAENSDYESTHLADITINVGGTTNSNLQVDIPQALFGLGQLNFNNLISVSVPFTAKEETGFYTTITYNI